MALGVVVSDQLSTCDLFYYQSHLYNLSHFTLKFKKVKRGKNVQY